MMMTRKDNPAVRRTIARQLLKQRELRRQGKSWLRGYKPPPGDGVERIWAAATRDQSPVVLLKPNAFDEHVRRVEEAA